VIAAMPKELDLETLRGFLGIGFHRFLRMEIVAADAAEGTIAIRLPFRDEYSRIPAAGDYHGGIIAALLDVAGTFAASLVAKTPTPTMNLRTDYLRPPVRCDLLATARVLRRGRSAIVADVEIADPSGAIYAVARGTWSVPAGNRPE
jgi:uncharacterized protein (TIGR00369 family)